MEESHLLEITRQCSLALQCCILEHDNMESKKQMMMKYIDIEFFKDKFKKEKRAHAWSYHNVSA